MTRDWRVTERRLRGALTVSPDDARLLVGLGEARLAQGDYGEGFALLRRWWDVPERYAASDMDFPIPRWSGEDLHGKRFLVCSSAGLGDQIMMARFVPLLMQLGATVDWLCTPPLARLFQRSLGVNVIPAVGEVRLGAYDFFSPCWDLASLFFPPLTDPPSAPYLAHPPASTLPGLTIGVVTQGNPKHVNDANRSLPEPLGRELLSLPGAVDLKPENTGARDLYDTAQIVAGLDLVISVDTSVAHLAGAMGKPVWIMLPAKDTDWRWMEGRADSPWYPSGRLFRQPSVGAWRPVLDEVREALADRKRAATGEGVDGVAA